MTASEFCELGDYIRKLEAEWIMNRLIILDLEEAVTTSNNSVLDAELIRANGRNETLYEGFQTLCTYLDHTQKENIALREKREILEQRIKELEK